MATAADRKLEEQLLEAGNKLVDPPLSAEELLILLDQVESCLSRVEQSPIESTENALAPSVTALIDDQLLRHADVDVKVAVASCISEITRITAPDAPYDDDQMKEVFQLIVSSFENLCDMSSRSYTKRTVILETVSKVRSCVVMLDLECDALILEMFQHFLKEIREHHPENVFSSMETIMTLVLEESEDISLNLLTPVLDSVKKDNEEVLPIARRLGERVLKSCATKLKPYLVQAVNTLGISLDDYSDVLASICQDASGSLEQNDEDENKSVEEPLEESAPVVRVDAKEAAPPQQDNPVGGRSPKSVMSNGIGQAAEDDTLVDSKSLVKQENTDCADQSKGINPSGNEEPNDLDTEKVDNSEQKLGQATNRRGKKLSSSTKSVKPSKGSYPANVKEDEKMIDSESHSKEVPSYPHVDEQVDNSEQKLGKATNRRGKKLSSSTISAEPSEGSYPANVMEDEKMIDSESHSKEVPSSPNVDIKVDNSEQKLGKATNRRGKKLSSSTKSAEPSEGSYPANVKEDEKMIDSESHSKEVPSSPNVDEKADNSEQKVGKATNRRGKKLSSSTKSAEPSEGSYPANVKEDEKMIDSESHSKEVPSSQHVDDSVEAAGLSKNDKEIDAKVSSLKAGDGETDVIASPSPNGHGENRSKKLGRPKKKESSAQELAAKDVPKKVHDVTSDSEAKPTKRLVKKALGHRSDVKKNTVVYSVKKGSGTASDPDAKKHSTKKAEDSSKGGGGSSSRQSEDKKRQERGKGKSEMGVAKSSVKDEDKEMVSSLKSAMKSSKDEESEESPKTNLKRKRTPRKENESGTKKYGENLVGLRVKVWWPDDEMFYEGVVESFDSAKKRHQVNYDDGDVEILNLKKEIWEIITVDADSDGEEGGDRTGADASADIPPKKKGKTSAGESKKEGNRVASSISGGDTSSKSKGKYMKSSHKSKDGSIADLKSKASKIVIKSEDEVLRKTKNHTPKSGGSKSIDAAQKMTSKSKDTDKDDGLGTPKLPGKSKQETPKTGKSKQETSKTAASKAKSTKSGGGKSNANGIAKVKFNLLKTKDSDNDNSEDSTEEVEEVKGKISSSSKAGGSEVKSGKKRARN